MHPALDQLQKVLNLEVQNGYTNKAIIGGLPKMLVFWEPNARRGGLDPAFITSIVEQLQAYPDQAEAERAAAIRNMLGMIRAAAAGGGPAKTAPPAAPATSVDRPAPQPHPAAPRTAAPPPPRGEAPPSQPAPQHKPVPPVERASPAPVIPAAATPKPPAQATPVPPAGERPATPPARPSQPAPQAQGAAPARPAAAKSSRGGKGGKPAGPPPPRARRDIPDYAEEPVDPRPRRPQALKPLRAEQPVNPNAGLDAPLTVLKGIGPETAKDFARLGLETLRDLLMHFPRRYDDYSRMKTINRLVLGEECTVIGTILQAQLRPMRNRSGKMLKVIIGDPTGELEVTFFNQEFLARTLTPGRQIVISGRIDQYLGKLTIVPDEWEDLDRDLLSTGRIVPVYRSTAGIKQKTLRRLTVQMAQYWAPRQPDPLPADVIERAGLMKYGDALAQIHFPDNQERLAAAQHRLAFDELLMVQLGVMRQRRQWQSHAGTPLPASDEWLAGFLASLPYPLTGAQRRAVNEVRADMARDVPMNRLLQGDVGAGKTAVAAVAMAMAVQSGAQAALMAPTSILAEQHFRTLSALLAPALGDPGAIRLLQGSTSGFEKAAIYEGLQSGAIRVVVGTHALIEDPVEFARLGLVVVDEQHRFGVAQRAALRGKGASPHLLVMTATPIPRSLALTVYGDLDLSVLDEMPPGRQPIQTYLMQAQERERGYAYIRSQLQKGRQAFIIFPLVEESEKIDAKAAVEEHARLQREAFADFRLGLLHGRLKPGDKEAVMSSFRAGEFDVLVSTSVVEVGVDVPNATVMLIEGANRFGLAQLHQFRGRVGRGEHASFCLLVSDTSNGHTDERLKAMVESQDGFYLAQKDLDLRGPGDFLGTRQSGLSGLNMARLSDLVTIEKARREATAIFERDADLRAPEHEALARKLEAFWTVGAADAS
jgi:ATP-dependent DNA helicase RecG